MPEPPPPFSWVSGEVHAEVVLGAALLSAAYAVVWVRGPRRGAGEPARFFAGLGVLLLALNGPLHDLSDYYLFSAHMVQHLLLTLLAPPLRWQLGRFAVRATTRPVPALALYAVALVAWHMPGPYDAALQTHGWHVVEHLVLIATAVLAWWPVASASALAPRLHYGTQILYLFAFGIPMTVVASMITGAEHVLYPYYAAAPRLWALTPLADQRLGGVIMWVPAGLIPLAAFTVVFFRWAAAEADDEPPALGKPLL